MENAGVVGAKDVSPLLGVGPKNPLNKHSANDTGPFLKRPGRTPARVTAFPEVWRAIHLRSL